MPKLIPFKELNTLGVINITPNSFSDPKKFLNPENLKSALNHFKSFPSLILDLGFESTAPMNNPISLEEEKARFDTFFDSIKDVDLSGCWISFDTYKCQNFLYFEEKFQSRYHDCGFIFNDVSGVKDVELMTLLEQKRNQKNFFYIYSCTHIPSRDTVLKHNEFIKEGDIIEMCIENFKAAALKFNQIGIHQKILLDPCFGFSKSYEQNWDLVNRFDDLVNELVAQKIKTPWVIGISKKSFLRKSLLNSIDPFNDSEILHAKIIKELDSKKIGQIIYRVHDPAIVFKSIQPS